MHKFNLTLQKQMTENKRTLFNVVLSKQVTSIPAQITHILAFMMHSYIR